MDRCGTDAGIEIRQKIPSSSFITRGAVEASEGIWNHGRGPLSFKA